MIGKLSIITLLILGSILPFLSALNIPYQGSLEYKGDHLCGVTIISLSHFLTAAHCVQDKDIKDFNVRAGTVTRGQGGKVVKIKEFRIHPKFDNKTLDYDLAIIIPETSFPSSGYVTEFIQNIQIENKDVNLVKKTAITSGWGYDDTDTGFTETLMYLEMPILSRQICEQYVKMTDRMICGGYLEGGKSTCHGDAGGPLVLDNKLIGIVSLDTACGKPNTPDLFTDVRALKTWISENTQ